MKRPAAATSKHDADPLPKCPGLKNKYYPVYYMQSTVYLQTAPSVFFRVKPCSGKDGKVDTKVRVCNNDMAAAWAKVCELLSKFNS